MSTNFLKEDSFFESSGEDIDTFADDQMALSEHIENLAKE